MTGRPSPGRVIVIGSSNTDLVCHTDRLPMPGETIASTAFEIFPGGKAANQAVAAARSGAQVRFVGAFGDDPYGRDRRKELESENIDLRYSRLIADQTSGLALIAVDPSGENLIITVSGANDLISVDQFQAAFSNDDFDVVLLPNEAPPELVEQAVQRGSSAMVVLNAAPYQEHLRALVAQVDLLVCNEVEASQFLRRKVSPERARDDVSELANLTGNGAVITLGGRGAVGHYDGDLVTINAPEVHVVDTTGAGDALCGALAAWLAGGANFSESLKAGVAAGALAVKISGAQPSLPTRVMIEQCLSLD